MRNLIFGLCFCVLAITVYDAAIIVLALWRSNEVAALSEPFESDPVAASATLLVVGDSTARGTGAARSVESVAGRIGADFPFLHIDNLGTNGATTGAVVRQLSRASLDHYDLILIQVGGNDALRLTSLDRLRLQVDAALREAVALADHVVLMSTGRLGEAPAVPWPVSKVFTARARQIRDCFSAASSRHGAHYVDLFTDPEVSSPFTAEPERYYASDGLHPSGSGYGVWYSRLREQVPIGNWLDD